MSIFFSVYFLPLLVGAAILCRRMPAAWRTPFLLFSCLTTLAYARPLETAMLTLAVALAYVAARHIQPGGKRSTVLAPVGATVALLLFLRYLPQIFGAIHLGETEFALNYLVPLGISYFCFKLIAFFLDIHRGEIRDPSLSELLLYMFFIPIFPAGPIQRYQHFALQRADTIDASDIVYGLMRISIGFFKKVVIVGMLLEPLVAGDLYRDLQTAPGLEQLASSQVALFLLVALVYAYLDLSSYADIAIGSSKLFGYSIMENMNYPLFRRSLAEYWRCWHISLSSWCRDYVYLPVLGQTRKPTLALYSSFFIMGMWHDISATWFIWGLWHASGIWFYSRWRRTQLAAQLEAAIPNAIGFGIGMAATVSYSALGFAFIMMPTAEQSFRVLVRALGVH